MIRVYLIVAALALAAIAYQTYQRKQAERRAEVAEVRADQAEVQVEAEKVARAHEQEIARNASNEFHSHVQALEADLAARPLRPVVIRVPVSSGVPEASSAARAASGADAEAQGRLNESIEIDLAPELTAYSLDCQKNTAQLEALISWTEMR